jgi:hypothetical protein
MTSAWHAFDDGRTVGTAGSEGRIVVDEEHPAGIRVTLEEKGEARYSVTCGIAGSMVHTCFFGSERAARDSLVRMKSRLLQIADTLPTGEADRQDWGPATTLMKRFVSDFA